MRDQDVHRIEGEDRGQDHPRTDIITTTIENIVVKTITDIHVTQEDQDLEHHLGKIIKERNN